MIDHAKMEAALRREICGDSERSYLEAVARYHIDTAAYAAQLGKLMEQIRFYPDLVTPEVRKAIRYLEQEMAAIHVRSFGVAPAWRALYRPGVGDL